MNDEEIIEEIIDAILDDDFKSLDIIVNNGFDPKYSTKSDNWNFLHQALLMDTEVPSVSMLKKLLNYGIDVNQKDASGWTPLHFASRIGDSEIISTLLESGANVDPENNDGNTPLRVLVSNNNANSNAVKVLLKNGANPDHKTSGCTVREYIKMLQNIDPEIIALFDKY